MKFKVAQASNHNEVKQGDAISALQKLEELQKPKRLVDFIEQFADRNGFLANIDRCIFALRESVGRQSVIFNSLANGVQIKCNMSAKDGMCTVDENIIYMSYDLFTCADVNVTREELARAIADILSEKVYGGNGKHFHWQLIFYLLGFNPLREQEEKAAAAKALKEI